jgi:feruloyl esterase
MDISATGNLRVALFISLLAIVFSMTARPAFAGLTCSVAALQPVAAADTTIASAAIVPLGGGSYCDVKGAITTTTSGQTGTVIFELGLPTPWGGRFLFLGNGGFAGSLQAVDNGDFAFVLGLGFAAAVTDTGHESIYNGIGLGLFDASFGLIGGMAGMPNLAATEDFSYRAVHLSTVAGETLTNQYYGAAMFSYFYGCSTGGRQGMVEAQKFPDDYNGIVAGDPAIGNPIAGFNWNDLALLSDSTGNSYLPTAKIDLLDHAVLSACDSSDGVIDGLIEDPRLCKFDPESIKCKGADAPTCLTAAQVATVKKIYAGATTPDGAQLYPGYTASDPGGVDGWKQWITGFVPPVFGVANPWGAAPGSFAVAPLQFSFQDQFMKYFVFQDPAYDSLTFDFANPNQIAQLIAIVTKYGGNGENTNLSPFFDAGGKLIMYHGWSDSALSPFATVDYYSGVAKTVGGGFKHLQDDARLFMVPGMHHCSGGPGPYNFDPLTPLIGWVEFGIAPDRIIGEVPSSGRTFPLCPYPSLAVYQGGGVNDAANWTCKAHTNHRLSPGHSAKGSHPH